MNTKTFKVEPENKMQNKIVTICACASRSFIDKDKVAEIAAGIEKIGYQVRIEADLCRKVMEAFTGMPEASSFSDMQDVAEGMILACYPRAVQAHFDRLGLAVDDGQIVDIRNHDYFEILAQSGISVASTNANASINAGTGVGLGTEAETGFPLEMKTDTVVGKEKYREIVSRFSVEEGVDAWYPVLDKTRCTECGKCHDFCLFGVYAVENKKVRVMKPQNCKNNCPACARMCPSKAIIFPKYEKSPINGGMSQEETFDPQAMDKMYRERLRMRLQQRRNSVSLIKN